MHFEQVCYCIMGNGLGLSNNKIISSNKTCTKRNSSKNFSFVQSAAPNYRKIQSIYPTWQGEFLLSKCCKPAKVDNPIVLQVCTYI